MYSSYLPADMTSAEEPPKPQDASQCGITKQQECDDGDLLLLLLFLLLMKEKKASTLLLTFAIYFYM